MNSIVKFAELAYPLGRQKKNYESFAFMTSQKTLDFEVSGRSMKKSWFFSVFSCGE